MSLKEALFTSQALQHLPHLISSLQHGSTSPHELPSIYPHIASLINGGYANKKIGLAVLKCSLVHMYTANTVKDNTDYLVKWWRSVTSCLKQRYSTDSVYRLGCYNLLLLSHISTSYVELLTEARSLLPVLVPSLISHPCKESLLVLQALCERFPSHIGRYYEEIRALCLTSNTLLSARVLGRLVLTGPAGKQGGNYVIAWNKMVAGAVTSLGNILVAVSGEGDTTSPSLLHTWQFTGTLADVMRCNKEISFLAALLSTLVTLSMDHATSFPLKPFKEFLVTLTTLYTQSITLPSTTEHFNRKSVVQHLLIESVPLLTTLTPVLGTSIYLLQPQLEQLCCVMLQRSCAPTPVLTLLLTLARQGAVFTTLPLTLLTSRLALTSLQQSGAVSKKQKTAQFSTFTFQSSSLGYHNEGEMVLVLEVLGEVITQGSGPQLKVEEVGGKCSEILGHKESFSRGLICKVYETLNIISTQCFNTRDILLRCSSIHNSTYLHFVRNEVLSVESQLHPERHSFRSTAPSSTLPLQGTSNSGDVSCHPNIRDVLDNWGISEGMQETFTTSHHSPPTVETPSKEEDVDVSSEEEEEEEMGGSEDEGTPFHVTPPTQPSIAGGVMDVAVVTDPANENIVNNKTDDLVILDGKSASTELADILSSFVDQPPSGDEM